MFIFITHISHFGHAQFVTGPVSMGAGSAGRAANDEGEQVFLNPALVSHAKGFALGYFYVDGYSAKDEHDKWVGVTVIDNTDDVLVPGGFTYVQRKRTFVGQRPVSERFFQLSLSSPILSGLTAGLAAHHLSQDVDQTDKYKHWNTDVGLHYNPTPDLGLAFVGYNLLDGDRDAPRFYRPLTKLAVGANYIFMPRFRGRLDVSRAIEANPKDRYKVQAGIESLLDAFLVFRVGYEEDGLLNRSHLSLGLGLAGPRVQMDYSFKKNLDNSRGALHGVDFRLPF